MELKIDVKSFVNAVNWVTKSYDNKDDRAYVALSINEDGIGALSHTNTTSYMKSDYTVLDVNFDGDDETEVDFAIDGTFLRKLAKAIASVDGEIVLSKKLKSKRTALEAKTVSGKFTLPLLDAKVSKMPKIIEIGEVDDNEFFDMLIRISKLCDTNTSGSSMFTGAVDLGFSTENNTVKLFATDRFALGEVALDFTPASTDDEKVNELLSKNVLLPYDKAGIVAATKGISTSISIIAESGSNGVLRLGYSFPDGRVALFSLLDATTFPSVEAMKKKATDLVSNQITVSKAELISAISVVSSLTWDEDHVYLNISQDGLIVSDSSDANALQVDHSSLEYEGNETYRAKFLRATLNESFSPITTSDVVLKWGEDSAAFVFEPITEDGQIVENVFVMSVLAKNN